MTDGIEVHWIVSRMSWMFAIVFSWDLCCLWLMVSVLYSDWFGTKARTGWLSYTFNTVLVWSLKHCLNCVFKYWDKMMDEGTWSCFWSGIILNEHNHILMFSHSINHQVKLRNHLRTALVIFVFCLYVVWYVCCLFCW